MISILWEYFSSYIVENRTCLQIYQMDKYWRRLQPATPFLQSVLSSELKNSKTFFTLRFTQQEEDIVLQTKFFKIQKLFRFCRKYTLHVTSAKYYTFIFMLYNETST